MLKKVYITVFGSGLGHASRMVRVANRLKAEGVEVKFSSSSEGSIYIRKKGYTCYNIPLIDISWKDGEIYVRGSLIRAPRLIFTFLSQIGKEIKIMKAFKPDLVLSDSRLSSIIASKLLSIPCILITNQIKVILPSKRFIVKFLERIEEKILGFLWSLSDRIFIPDLPPPYTIAEENVKGLRASKVKYLGFFPPLKEDNIEKLDLLRLKEKGKSLIFAQISGPPLTRPKIVKSLIDLALKLSKFNFVISLGSPRASTKIKKIKNSLIFGWCPYVEELFEISDLILIRGGHSSIGHALWSGKPMICIPIRRHSEQISNAKKVEKLGAGIYLDPDNLNEEFLLNSIERLFKGSYYKRCREIMNLCRKMDGLEALLEEIYKIKS
ncbi:MAG: glycosyltransferase family protein [Nitrososphaerales archaeon]